MRVSKVISLSLPPSIYENTRKIAQEEGRTYSELIREALRQYMDNREWKSLQKYGANRINKLGIKSKDVENLIHQYREETRSA